MDINMQLKDLLSRTSGESVEYFTGVDGYVMPFLKRIEVAKSPIKQIINATEVAALHSATDTLVHQQIARRAELGLEFRNIIRYQDRELKLEHSNSKALKETVFLPEKLSDFSGMYCTFGDYLTLSNLDAENPLGVMIKDKAIVGLFDMVFENLWTQGTKV